MKRKKHIDGILAEWPFDLRDVSARVCQGGDGREVLQLRVDMGLLQMETSGRPDGSRPHGMETYFDYLIAQAAAAGDEFVLSPDDCLEVDREFTQFYHRRICWLKLQRYEAAVNDADHTLALMDFCLRHSPDDRWTISHEQYRPFVLFHRTQACALAKLELDGAEPAVHEINRGLEQLRQFLRDRDLEEQFDEDEFARRLTELRESLRREYDVGRTLQEQLADAVAAEEYELAAQLRDEMLRRGWAH